MHGVKRESRANTSAEARTARKEKEAARLAAYLDVERNFFELVSLLFSRYVRSYLRKPVNPEHIQTSVPPSRRNPAPSRRKRWKRALVSSR